MQPGQLKRITDYFIEEAAEHLDTIEQGLLNLLFSIEDIERVNELYRAAHYIKGGAAMLGLNSIHRTAHVLENSFRLLRENPVRVDQKLKSLLIKVLDTLRKLVEQVDEPFALTEDVANLIISVVEPVFADLNKHLELLVEQAIAIPTNLTVFVNTPTERITLSGYCTVEVMNQVVCRVGGTIAHRSWQQDSNELLSTQMDMQLGSFSTLEALRAEIQSTGGCLEIVQIEPRYTGIDYMHECFDTCRGCRYYYGRWDSEHLLVCAVHPNGPEEERCRDWEPRNSETAQSW
jgi:chemotaxis protein histidine kinase CheA